MCWRPRWCWSPSATGGRWVYLDVGLFTGLVEAYGREHPLPDRGAAGRRPPLGGPVGETSWPDRPATASTCSTSDHRYLLPLDLRPGDRLRFQSAGAYTATYSTVGFNGFAPLREESTGDRPDASASHGDRRRTAPTRSVRLCAIAEFRLLLLAHGAGHRRPS